MRRGPVLGLVLALAAAPLMAQEPAAPEAVARKVVVLQALDKVTARISRLVVAVGGKVRFGSLDVTVRACRKTPPEVQPPESSAYLEVWDDKPNQAPVQVFSGWMFASSPAVSALEHPVYDIWVKDCRAAAASPAE